ncbi:MAG: hypothetical protein ACREBC_17795, partial [Pyrinomonadaceae bacterium]
DSPDVKFARAGLEKLWEHCSEYNGSQCILRFLAGALEQICFTLFSVKIDENHEHPWVYGHMVGAIVNEPESLDRLRPQLEVIAREAEQARDRYAAVLWDNVVQTLAPGATRWEQVAAKSEVKGQVLARVAAGEGLRLIAAALPSQAAAAAGRDLSSSSLEQFTDKILTYYPTIVHYRSLAIRRLIEFGPDMTNRSRANGVLDIHVCTATSSVANINGMPVVLVTDDSLILDAGTRANARNRLLSLSEYVELIDRPFGEIGSCLCSRGGLPSCQEGVA